MMQVIPKWKVTVRFLNREVVVWIYDHHIRNVLQKVAEMQFTENGLDQPVFISVGEAADVSNVQVGTPNIISSTKIPQ